MGTLKNITVIQWFGIVILFNTTLLGGAGQLGDLSLSAGMVKAILAVATLGNGFLGGLVTMFGGLGIQAQNVRNAGTTIDVGPHAPASLATMAVSNDPANNGIQPAPGAETAVAATAKRAE